MMTICFIKYLYKQKKAQQDYLLQICTLTKQVTQAKQRASNLQEDNKQWNLQFSIITGTDEVNLSISMA